MKFRLSVVITLATVSPVVLFAQASTLSISAASLNIDPKSTDSYSIQGAFTGLDFSSAQSVTLQVGPFSAIIPMNSFVQQPANVFTYQDSTGQTPYWISSLAIDANANTFTATASGVVLAGIENPFLVQLATDQASACSMARVGQSSPGGYQLTPGDGANEPCQIAQVTTETPAVPVGASTNVTFQIDTLPGASLDPSTLQLFRADGNAQPIGAPLCLPSGAGDGTYSCTVTFNEPATTTIPLLVEASAGGQTILAPGFSVQVVAPLTDDDSQNLTDIQNAMSQVQQNFTQFGDSAYSRILSLQAVRAMLQPQPGLTGQPVELCPDGLSIAVRSRSGIVVIFLLNDLFDLMGGGANSSAALVPRRKPRSQLRSAKQRLPPAQNSAGSTFQCGLPKRDIVDNDMVLLWDPGTIFWGPDSNGPQMVKPLMASKCPQFQVDTFSGEKANALSFGKFPDYGSIVINSHGGVDPNHRSFIMTGVNSQTRIPSFSATGPEGVSCVFIYPFGTNSIGRFFDEWDCYIHVYASYVKQQTEGLRNAVIFASACYSGSGDMAQAFTPLDRNNAYFGYDAIGDIVTGPQAGAALFNSLVNRYTNTGDAFLDAFNMSPYGGVLQRYGDSNLAYLGNPLLFSPQLGQDIAYSLAPGAILNLQAQLDGASGCDGIMNYHWINTANAGHLTPAAGGSLQDNFTSTDSLTTYKASVSSQGLDEITVDFYPNHSSDPAAAKACTASDLTFGQILRVVFDGQGSWNDTSLIDGSFGSAALNWHAAWEFPIVPNHGPAFPFGPFSGGLAAPVGVNADTGAWLAALPGATVTGQTMSDHPAPGETCGGPPAISTANQPAGFAVPFTPLLGIAGTWIVGSSIVPMWVETFGGGDFRTCDGFTTPTSGNYGDPVPGYPGFDTPAGIVMFNLDLSQWIGQPDHSMTVNVPPVDLKTLTGPNAYDEGETMVTGGTLTFTSRTVANPDALLFPSNGQPATPNEKLPGGPAR